MAYYINGWRERKGYFLSFGFTEEEIEQMINGAIIKREQNEFWIEVE